MESGEKPGESVTVMRRYKCSVCDARQVVSADKSDTWTYTIVFAGTENNAMKYARKRRDDLTSWRALVFLWKIRDRHQMVLFVLHAVS